MKVNYPRLFLKTLSAIILLTSGTAACALCWLYSWTWRSELSDFHESWTAEERKALTGLHSYLCHQWVKDAVGTLPVLVSIPGKQKKAAEEAYFKFSYESPEHELPPLEEQRKIITAWREQTPALSMSNRLKAACIVRCIMAPVAEQLEEIAATGNAACPSPQVETDSFLLNQLRVDDVTGMTPAIAASQSGHFDALRALIRHGAAPNAQMRTHYSHIPGDDTEGDLPITPLLGGISTTSLRYPWSERMRHAEFLLQHGADLNHSPFVALCCSIDLIIHKHPGTWLWALEHGLTPSINDFCSIIEHPDTLPLIRYILEHKLVDINDRSGNATPIQTIVWAAIRAESMDKLTALEPEEKLTLLLQAGANPNLICSNAAPQRPGESDEEFEERQDYTPRWAATPASERLKSRIEELADSTDADTAARRKLLERLAELIRAHS